MGSGGPPGRLLPPARSYLLVMTVRHPKEGRQSAMFLWTQEFIAHQEMLFIATANSAGACDRSFRAGSRGSSTSSREITRLPGISGQRRHRQRGQHHGESACRDDLFGFRADHDGHTCERAGSGPHPRRGTQLAVPSERHDRSAKVKGGRRPEAWIAVTVNEAYIHCSKRIPLLARSEKPIGWSSDDEANKGGDSFRIKSDLRSVLPNAEDNALKGVR